MNKHPSYHYPKGESHPKWKGGTSLNKKQYNRDWYKAHPNYYKEYRIKNIDKVRDRDNQYSKLNRRKAQKRKSVAKWRAKEENKRLIRFWNLQRHYKKLGAEGKHSLKEWEALKLKYNYTCLSCGRMEPEIKLTEDHIIPLSKNGTNYIENIQPLCGICNCKKYTQIINYA